MINHTTNFDLNSFLEHYGYLGHARANAGDGSSEEEVVEFAIKAYQQFIGIEATGKLDEETESHMKRPRCGVPDFFNGAAEAEIRFDSRPYLRSYIESARSHFGDGACHIQVRLSSIERYQQDHGIEATGKLDDATISHMKMNNPPRSDRNPHPRPRVIPITIIRNIAQRLGFRRVGAIRNDIEYRAYKISQRIKDQRCTRGRNSEALVAAYVYVACQQKGKPLTVKEICSVFDGATEEEIGQAIEYVNKHMNVAIHEGDNLRAFCSDLGMSNVEVKAVEETIQKAGDLIQEYSMSCSIGWRSYPLFAAAAIIFMVTQLSDSKKPLRDISGVTALAECTIKNAYKDLYPHAEKIIPEWYAKGRDLKNLMS